MSKGKQPAEQVTMREGGSKLGAVLEAARQALQPGITTADLDEVVQKEILRLGGKPAFLNYEGFPGSACISVNDEVIHGIPGDRVIEEGDLVTVDAGLWWNGLCVDAARSWCVGDCSSEASRLIKATEEALAAGVKAAQPGSRTGAIGAAVEAVANRYKLGIIRHFTGHGVGYALHEDPSIPNYGRPSDGPVLKEGMTICIEPMFTLGGDEVNTLADGWTVVTADGSLAAQIEHTVLITKHGPEVLV